MIEMIPYLKCIILGLSNAYPTTYGGGASIVTTVQVAGTPLLPTDNVSLLLGTTKFYMHEYGATCANPNPAGAPLCTLVGLDYWVDGTTKEMFYVANAAQVFQYDALEPLPFEGVLKYPTSGTLVDVNEVTK